MRRAISLLTAVTIFFPIVSSAASCPALSRGSSGTAVSSVQQILYDAYQGFPAPTGYFGPVTEAAVKQWQSEHDIEALGIVGPQTAAAMHVNLCTTVISAASGTASNSNEALIDSLLAQIKVLQAQLATMLAGSSNASTPRPIVSTSTTLPTPNTIVPTTTFVINPIVSTPTITTTSAPTPTPTPTPTPAPTPTPTPTPTPPAINCASLLNDGFPMGGYGGDYYASGGNVITVPQMQADGWNIDGPLYRAKSDAYMNAVASAGICTIFTPSPWGVDNALATRIFNDGVFSATDEQAYLDIVKTQVNHVLSNPSWDATIAAWYVSESNNESPAYITLVRDTRNLLRTLDPKGRPVISWLSREAPTGSESLIPYLDGIFVGHYIGYADNRAQFLFAAERARAIKATYGQNKIVIIDPPMCESTTDWTGQCGPAFGMWTPSQLASYVGKFVRHDLYALIASGMRGFMIFSFSDRTGFDDFARYYGAYAEVVSELHGSGLYNALMAGGGTPLSVSVTAGPSSVSFAPSWDPTIDRSYAAVNARMWTNAGKTFVVISNTSTGPITATVSGMPNGTYTDYIRSGTATASGGSMTVSITGLDAALYIQ